METGPSPESARHISPEELAAALGIAETPEMAELRMAIVQEYAIDVRHAAELKTRYQIMAEELADQFQGEQYAQAQIAVMLACASMKRIAGLMNAYALDLLEAESYAGEMGFDGLAEQINQLRAQASRD